MIIDGEFDVCALTETWMKGDIRDNCIIAELVPLGFKMQHTPRPNGRGGGVAVVHRESLDVTVKQRSNWASFESMECVVSTPVPLRLVVVFVLCVQRLISNGFLDLVEIV